MKVSFIRLANYCIGKSEYEINDWFEQFQIFDDATGAHNNDLILQGLTVQLAYRL